MPVSKLDLLELRFIVIMLMQSIVIRYFTIITKEAVVDNLIVDFLSILRLVAFAIQLLNEMNLRIIVFGCGEAFLNSFEECFRRQRS